MIKTSNLQTIKTDCLLWKNLMILVNPNNPGPKVVSYRYDYNQSLVDLELWISISQDMDLLIYGTMNQ